MSYIATVKTIEQNETNTILEYGNKNFVIPTLKKEDGIQFSPESKIDFNTQTSLKQNPIIEDLNTIWDYNKVCFKSTSL